MQETKFIEQNKKKWSDFEVLMADKTTDPNKTSDLFIEITEDLSFSKTYYPNRWVRVFLNGQAQEVFSRLYSKTKLKPTSFVKFWTDQLPVLFYEARKDFLLAFIIFIFFAFVGVFSSASSPDFARTVLGDRYVAMTKANIDNGDPMAVYKGENEFDMALAITFNNIQVAFLTFIMGVFFAFGSIIILIKNAIMVGTFQYFFYEYGYLSESALTIWQHGTLEISAIIIAGAAGITLGKGLVFPGSLPRWQSFQISARRGMKIMVSTVPIFIMAGFIEGFITRQTETPDSIRLLVIIASLFVILFIYVFLPFAKYKRDGIPKPTAEKIFIPLDYQIDYSEIKTNPKIFSDTFVFFRKHFSIVFQTVTIFAILGAALQTAIAYLSSTFIMEYAAQDFFLKFFYNLSSADNYLKFATDVLFFTFITLVVHFLVIKNSANDVSAKSQMKLGRFIGKNFGKVFFIVLVLNAILLWDNNVSVFVFFAVLPYFIFVSFVACYENKNSFVAIKRFSKITKKRKTRMYGLYLILSFIGYILYLLVNSPLAAFYLNFIQDLFVFNEDLQYKLFNTFVLSFLDQLSRGVSACVAIIGLNILYFTMLEINEAPTLKKRIEMIGKKR